MENLSIEMDEVVKGPHKLKTIFEKNLGYTYLSQIRDQLGTSENRTKTVTLKTFNILSYSRHFMRRRNRFFSFQIMLRRRSYGFENIRMYVVKHCYKMYRAKQ